MNGATAVGLEAVRVWDLPTRIFHWLLAALVVASVITAQVGGNAMAWHFRSGYAVFALLAFRILWGVVGGRWSRFASFIHAPATTLRYLRGEHRPEENFDVGHNPLGALSVLGLLAVLSMQVATGLFADDEISSAGPLVKFVSGATSSLATSWHTNFGQWLIIALVLLHVAAILFYLLKKRQNLIRPMLTGDKPLGPGVPPSTDNLHSRRLALALLLACAAGVAWLVGLGA
ncbi:MAG: cytochrome b/b6 domain-containing protein [Rhizobacter sp.]|nr:cytochrome b/b6 domain-containing protein [Rhizobacter sp.]